MVKDCHGVEAQQAKEKQTSKCKHHYETLMRTTRIDASLAFLFASFPLQLLLPLPENCANKLPPNNSMQL